MKSGVAIPDYVRDRGKTKLAGGLKQALERST